MATDSLKILLYNVGYCTELDGSLKDYFFRSYRYLYTPRRVQSRAVHSLIRLVETHNPDVCCFVEIHRNLGRLPSFQAFAEYDVENKYGIRSWLRRMPFFRKNCNGFFAQNELAFRKHWFKNGAKKLIYEIDLKNDTTLFFAHMSLRASVRKKQYQELKKWVQRKKRVILCGDFNTFRNEDDLEAFAADCGLNIVTPPNAATFPRKQPNHTIDLFLCSPSIQIKEVQVLEHAQASDHLPVLVEMTL